MRVFLALAIVMALAHPAFAQQAVPRYGEKDKEKSPQNSGPSGTRKRLTAIP